MTDPLREPLTFERANPLQKGLRRLAAIAPGSWVFARVLHRIDRPVVVDGSSRRFRAVEVDGERRRRIWEQGLRVYPGWSQYERRASHRRIAVFVLEPV